MSSTKPKTKTKQTLTKEQKQEKAAREKRLLSAKEKILRMKRDVLKIVESMLEKNISMKWFLQNCPKLSQQDYDDVVQERSIDNSCGYPLCNKPIAQVFKQQYRISKAANKIYDVTERKCFCCDQCYKASNYLKAQLSEVPLHLRQAGMPIPINLISEKENRGCAGEEVEFQVYIAKDEIEKPCSENTTTNLSNILQEEVKGFEKHLSKLKITEHTYEKPFVFGCKTQEESIKTESEVIENGLESSDSEDDPENNDEPAYFPEHCNINLYTNKYMPVPLKINEVQLIDPIKAVYASESTTNRPTIEFISDVFYDWFTEDTLKYLLGEKNLYAKKADLLFQTMVAVDNLHPEKLTAIKNEYVDVCLKVDKLEEEGEFSDSLEFDIDEVSCPCKRKTRSLSSENLIAGSSKHAPYDSIPKRRFKNKSKEKKAVSFAPDVKEMPKEQMVNPEEESESNQSRPEPNFPLVDSVSQNALRRQVLSGKLKAVYFEVLPMIGLSFRDIRDGVKRIVETFSLTPTNITYKPKEWKCIALVLLRILTQNTLKDLENFDSTHYLKLCEFLLKDVTTLSFQQINDLVRDLVSVNLINRVSEL